MAYFEDIWVKDKSVTIDQIVSYVGQGPLVDNSPKQKNIRQFFQQVESAYLVKYVESCLLLSDDWVGYVFQDLVNEIGSRLDFNVTFGNYRGSKEIGFDGIWNTDTNSIVTEAKKSVKFLYDLSVFENYRKELIKADKIHKENSSILLVVGDDKTENLEAQIRGSKFAWTIRIVGIRSLIKLLELKEDSDDNSMFDKINRVLTPQEYTKVDGIIDLVFSTAEAVKSEVEIYDNAGTNSDVIEKNQIEIIRQNSLPIIGEHFHTILKKKSRTFYTSNDGEILVGCYVSKEHKDKNYRYWYGVPFKHLDVLKGTTKSYIAFVCESEKQILVIPSKDFAAWTDGFNITNKPDKAPYWHIHISEAASDFSLIRKKSFSQIKLMQYLLK